MTEKLYYNDSHKLDFKSELIDITKFGDKYHAILDKTYFYPTSGGQSFDTGYINDIKVIDVFEKDGKIIHVLEKEIPKGIVDSKIDYERRLENMQHHTGQHLLSQAFIQALKAPTISIHLGDDICNIEIVKKELNQEEVNQVEELANNIIYQNRPINMYYVDESEINELNLRKPPKKKGQDGIRVIDIEGFDISACGGTHAKSTGELGLIKIIGWEKYKGNIKVDFMCGLRALRDYRFKNIAIKNISTKFSAKDKQIEEIIYKSINDTKENLKELSNIKKELAFYKAKELIENADNFNDLKIISKEIVTEDIFFLKLIAQELVEFDNTIAFLYSNIGDKTNLIFCCNPNLEFNMNTYLSEVFKTFSGKGGGKPNFVQGSINNIVGKLTLHHEGLNLVIN
ncbi:MAG: DHHA1 domain-containing protein [Candidatus Sericytochromatia bacterium]